MKGEPVSFEALKALFFLTVLTLMVGRPALASDRAYSVYEFSEMMEMAKSPSVNSVADFLANLPLEIRDDFTLIHTSGSLQGSSYENPRALIYNQDGSLMMTFNGDPSQRGYEAVEVARFDQEKRKIEFYEIAYKADAKRATHGNHIPLAADDIAFEDPTRVISKANPMKCMFCHSAEPSRLQTIPQEQRLASYIWQSYDQWPQNYGSDDDYVSYGSNIANVPDELSKEIRALWKFKESVAPNSKRYSKLVFGYSKNSPFVDTPGPINISLRRNLLVGGMIIMNQSLQLAQILHDRLGSKTVLDHLYKQLLCRQFDDLDTNYSSPNAFEFDNEVFSGIEELLNSGRPIVNPSAVILPHDSFYGYRNWSSGIPSFLISSFSSVGISGHVLGAMFLVEARAFPNVENARRQLVDIYFPDGTEALSSSVGKSTNLSVELLEQAFEQFVDLDPDPLSSSELPRVEEERQNICTEVKAARQKNI